VAAASPSPPPTPPPPAPRGWGAVDANLPPGPPASQPAPTDPLPTEVESIALAMKLEAAEGAPPLSRGWGAVDTANLKDVKPRANCALEAVTTALRAAKSFRRAFDQAEVKDAAPQALRRALDALPPLDRSKEARRTTKKRQYDQAVDDLRVALAEREGGDRNIKQELATGGAHLDVAEVLGELVAALTGDASTKPAADALTSVGRITQAPCKKCGASNSDGVDEQVVEYARDAPATQLKHAKNKYKHKARLDTVYRTAHNHSSKSCDACHARGACAVTHTLAKCASTLVLAVAWTGTDRSKGDVHSVMDLALTGLKDAAACFDRNARAGPRHLVALVMFRGHHYTSFVRKGLARRDGWEWHDRGSIVPLVDWAAVKARAEPSDGKGAMLPYLLVYDEAP